MYSVKEVYEMYIKMYEELKSKCEKYDYDVPFAASDRYTRVCDEIKVPDKFEKSEKMAGTFIAYCISQHSKHFYNCDFRGDSAGYVYDCVVRNLKQYINPEYEKIDYDFDLLRRLDYVGYKASLILAFAIKYFIDYRTVTEVPFDHDKWESRGDYCSKGKVTFSIDKDHPEGFIHMKEYEPYSLMF